MWRSALAEFDQDIDRLEPVLAGRGFGVPGKTFKSLDDVPQMVAQLARTGGPAIWDFHISDKVLSPTIRRAHPAPTRG